MTAYTRRQRQELRCNPKYNEVYKRCLCRFSDKFRLCLTLSFTYNAHGSSVCQSITHYDLWPIPRCCNVQCPISLTQHPIDCMCTGVSTTGSSDRTEFRGGDARGAAAKSSCCFGEDLGLNLLSTGLLSSELIVKTNGQNRVSNLKIRALVTNQKMRTRGF